MDVQVQVGALSAVSLATPSDCGDKLPPDMGLSPLCQACEALFSGTKMDDFWMETKGRDKHHGTRSLQESSQEGCRLCLTILRGMQHKCRCNTADMNLYLTCECEIQHEDDDNGVGIILNFFYHGDNKMELVILRAENVKCKSQEAPSENSFCTKHLSSTFRSKYRTII